MKFVVPRTFLKPPQFLGGGAVGLTDSGKIIKYLIILTIISFFHENFRIDFTGPHILTTNWSVATNRPYVHEVFCILAFALWLFNFFVNRTIRRSSVPLILPSMLIVLLLVNAIRASGNYDVPPGIVRAFIEGVIMFIVCSRISWSEAEKQNVGIALIFTASISATAALISQYFSGAMNISYFYRPTILSVFPSFQTTTVYRASGFWYGINVFAVFMAMSCVMATQLCLIAKKRKKMLLLTLFSIVVILIFLALLNTFTRGSWIGFCFGIAYLLWKNRANRWFLYFMLMIIGMIVYYMGLDLASNILIRLRQTEELGVRAGSGRLQHFLTAIEVAFYNPFGVGLYGFSKKAAGLGAQVRAFVHNLYMSMMLNLGIPALIIFIIIIKKVFCNNQYKREIRDIDNGIRASIVTFLFCGLTEELMFNPHVSILFWILLGINASIEATKYDVIYKISDI